MMWSREAKTTRRRKRNRTRRCNGRPTQDVVSISRVERSLWSSSLTLGAICGSTPSDPSTCSETHVSLADPRVGNDRVVPCVIKLEPHETFPPSQSVQCPSQLRLFVYRRLYDVQLGRSQGNLVDRPCARTAESSDRPLCTDGTCTVETSAQTTAKGGRSRGLPL